MLFFVKNKVWKMSVSTVKRNKRTPILGGCSLGDHPKEHIFNQDPIMCISVSDSGSWVLACGSRIELHRVDPKKETVLICTGRFDKTIDRARCCILLSDQADIAASGHYNGVVLIWRRNPEDVIVPNEGWKQMMSLDAHSRAICGLGSLSYQMMKDSCEFHSFSCVSCSSSDIFTKVWTVSQDDSNVPGHNFDALSHSCGVVCCSRFKAVVGTVDQPYGILTCSRDGMIHSWTFDGKWTKSQSLGPMGPIISMTFPTGTHSFFSTVHELVGMVGSDRVNLWKCHDTKFERAAIVQHGRKGRVLIRGCYVRHDRQLVAVCDSEGSIRLWREDFNSCSESQGWHCVHVEVASPGEDVWACAFGHGEMSGYLFYALGGPEETTLKKLNTWSFSPAENPKPQGDFYSAEDTTPPHLAAGGTHLSPTRRQQDEQASCAGAAHRFRGVSPAGAWEPTGPGADAQPGGARQWEAWIYVGGKRRLVGRFDGAEEAADAWDRCMLATFDPQVSGPAGRAGRAGAVAKLPCRARESDSGAPASRRAAMVLRDRGGRLALGIREGQLLTAAGGGCWGGG